MKKMLALLMAVCMLLGMLTLAGCSNSTEAPSTGSQTDAPSDEPTAEAPAAEETDAGLNGTLNYVSWMTKGEDLPLLEGFMSENPGVEVVNRSLEGGDTYLQTLMPMILNGDTPDVFMIDQSMLKELAEDGHIKPIDDLPGVAEQNAANPGLAEMVSYNGKTYGYIIAGNIGYGHVYYNTKYFEAHGLEVPTTYDEFEALCAEIKELGDEPLIISAGDTWSALYFGVNQMFRAYANLGEINGKNGAQRALLTGEAKMSDVFGDCFRQLASYRDKGWVSQAGLSMGWESACQLFVDGGSPMFASGNWVPTSAPITGCTNEDFELGAFPIPGIPADDGKCYESAGVGLVMVMSADSKNPEAQEALFNYIKREDVLTPYLNSNGFFGINVNTDVAPALEYSYSQLKDSSRYTLEPFGMSSLPAGWNANLSQYNADIFSGVDVEELLQKLDNDFETAVSAVNVQEILDTLK